MQPSERSTARSFPGGGQTFKKNIIVGPHQTQNFDPFLLMAEDWMRVPGGFQPHPHRGFETITLVLEGACKHSDNRGNTGVIGPGQMQYMTAGGGVVHAEMPHGREACHLLQLWVNLPRSLKSIPSRYQDVLDPPVLAFDGGEARVILGASGSTVNTSAQASIPGTTVLDVIFTGPGSFTHAIPASHNAFLYVVTGTDGAAGATPIQQGDVLRFGPDRQDEEFSLLVLSSGEGQESSDPLRIFVAHGEPIREPIIQRGPFVVNSEEEVLQAFTDYENGVGGLHQFALN